ncbi:MAG: hypothetical protein U1A78_05680 [Polyangia bacterium]
MDLTDRPQPVTVQINGTAALLLLRLMEQLGTEDGGGVISRALGLLELAVRARREGRALCLIDRKTGASSDVAF